MGNDIKSIQPSSIETIDRAIYSLINKTFNLHTNTNEGFKKVPVLWIFPERAYQSKDKNIRDSVGKLKLPLITVERTSFNKDPNFKGGFQANMFPDTMGPRGYRKHQKRIGTMQSKGSTRKFASADSSQKNKQYHYPTNNKKVVYEEVYTPIPVWVTCMYSVTLRTEYQQQMNDLLTPFATRTGNINALLAQEGQHKYETFIEADMAFSNNISNLGEEERSFGTKVNLKVLGYLMGDGANEEVPKIIRKETVVELKLIRERTILGDEKPWETDDKKYRDI